MLIRLVLLCGLLAGGIWALAASSAGGPGETVQVARGGRLGQRLSARSAERARIRAMPILERPNRPGHFYGNTVRRMARRRMAN